MLTEAVADLLQDFGSDLVLTRAGNPTYDPTAGTVANAAGTTLTVRGVFINYMDRDVDGTLVRMGDRKLLISAEGSDGAPEIHDTVDGMKIIDVRSFAPNGTDIAWTCQVRK